MNKNKTIANILTLKLARVLLLSVVVSSALFLGTKEASAASVQWTAGGNSHGIITVFNASTDKDVYAPGENVTITASANSSDSSYGPNTRGLNAITCLFGCSGGTNRQGVALDLYDYLGGVKSCGRGMVDTVTWQGDGDSGSYVPIQVPEFTTNCGVSDSVVAPTTSGVYTIATMAGCGGACEWSSLQITVAQIKPPLTINLSVSPADSPSSVNTFATIPYGSAVDVYYSSTGCSSSTLNPGSIGASSNFSNDASGVVRYGPLTTPGTYKIFYLCSNPDGYSRATISVSPAPVVQLYFSFLNKIKSFLASAFV